MPQRRAATSNARPIRGKDEAFTARLTTETRSGLRKAAEAAGHSMSSELEILLRSALAAREARANQIDALFQMGWDAARQVVEHAGVGPGDSAEVHSAVRDIITEMLKRLPAPTPAQVDKAPERQGAKPKQHKLTGRRDIDVES